MAVNQITEGVIWKQLLYFFFPILFGTFFQQLYNTADAVIVGQFVGTQALAAVGGATGSLINFFVNLFVGLASGTTVVIAQAYGAHDAESVGGTVHTSVALALAAGLGLTAVGVAAAPWALSAMGTPADIMDFALIYLRVYMLGTIPSFLYNVGSGILRAVGDTRRPLYFLIIACLVNIALDVVLVAVLGMGVLGAALATILSQGVSAVLVLVGAYIRTSVQETQDFSSAKKEVAKIRYPMLEAFKRYPKTLTACVGARFVEGIAFNVFGVFSLTYLTQTCGVSRTVALMAVVVASGVMACFIPMWGSLADRIGKARIFGTAALLLGVTAYPVFWVLHNYATTNLFFVYMAIIVPFGIIYAAAYASMASLFSESFDPTVRYSSISFVYQFSGIFASGLTPMIATMLVQANDSQPWYLCGYLLVAGVISALATAWISSLKSAKAEPRALPTDDAVVVAGAVVPE